MTHIPYNENPADGIDAAPHMGRGLSEADQVLFARYHTAFQIAIYWPCVENFRACVEAFDKIKGLGHGAHQEH